MENEHEKDVSLDRLERKNAFDGGLIFGAADFHKRTGRHLLDDDSDDVRIFRRYGDPETGLMRPDCVRYRPCVCGADDWRTAFIRYGFCFVICKQCGMLYTNPILKGHILEEFYRNETRWMEVLQNEVQKDLDQKKYTYGLELIGKHVGNVGTLLDVGTGPGLFLHVARDHGWCVQGVEFNEREVATARAEGLDVVQHDVFSSYFDERRYTAIALWEVLEHVDDPAGLIRRLRCLLDPGGVLFILVPNGGSFLNRMLHERSNTFTGYCHLTFFDSETLPVFLEREGFKVLEIETIISEINNIKNHLTYDHPYSGVQGKEFDFLTPTFIHDNVLGCKLMALARRL